MLLVYSHLLKDLTSKSIQFSLLPQPELIPLSVPMCPTHELTHCSFLDKVCVCCLCLINVIKPAQSFFQNPNITYKRSTCTLSLSCRTISCFLTENRMFAQGLCPFLLRSGWGLARVLSPYAGRCWATGVHAYWDPQMVLGPGLSSTLLSPSPRASPLATSPGPNILPLSTLPIHIIPQKILLAFSLLTHL